MIEILALVVVIGCLALSIRQQRDIDRLEQRILHVEIAMYAGSEEDE